MAKKQTNKESGTDSLASSLTLESISQLHLKIGWWTLLIFLTLGIVLEIQHAMKVSSYLGADSGVRRLMWTLAHTHGTLLALVQIVFALTLTRLSKVAVTSVSLTGKLLATGSLLMPTGFFLGGLTHYEADPGIGVFLVPIGAILLLLAVSRATIYVTSS